MATGPDRIDIFLLSIYKLAFAEGHRTALNLVLAEDLPYFAWLTFLLYSK